MTFHLLRYRNRDIYPSDVAFIQSTIQNNYSLDRTKISQILCEAWNWKQASGRLKEYACRDLLLRLEERGHIQLPPRLRSPNGPGQARRADQLPLPLLDISPLEQADLPTVVLRPIEREERRDWRALVHHFHYLGDAVIPGEHILYYAFVEERLVACLAWGAAARSSALRKDYIGWDEATKRQNLSGVVNNLRFLIFPWIKLKNLASRILAGRKAT